MCHYCGCREMPLLHYIAEHERSINHGGAAVRALDRVSTTGPVNCWPRWLTSCDRTGGARRTDCSP